MNGPRSIYLTALTGILWREALRFFYQRERFLAALVRPLIWLFIFAAGFRSPQLPALDESIRDPALLLGRLLAEFARVESEGGLYALAAESPGLERPDREAVEASLLDELDPQRVGWVQGDHSLSPARS